MSADSTINNPEVFINADASDELAVRPIIKVIGVGGGGGNAANYLFNQGIENVTFLVCNTDMHALRELQVPNRIVLGPEITHGLGAGDNPELGRQAAEASVEEIRRELSDDTRMVFITAGMGGGTGTGAAPIVAALAKEMGILTIGIVTIPFFFEGEKKILKALEGAEKMRENVDSLLIVNNQRLTEIYRDLKFVNAFEKADDTLANATRSIAEIINTRGYINVDFKDVQTTLKDSSTAIISTGYGEGEHRVTKAIKNALNSPLLRNSDIKSSKRLLFYLYFNPNATNMVSMEEMDEITQFTGTLSPNIGIKWGSCFDESLGESVKMTILASGFDITIKGKSSEESSSTSPAILSFGGSAETGSATAEKSNDRTKSRIEDEYGQGKLTEHLQAMARAKYVVLQPSQFDDEEVIHLLESAPAFSRDMHLTEKIRTTGVGLRVPETKKADEAPDETPRTDNVISF